MCSKRIEFPRREGGESRGKNDVENKETKEHGYGPRGKWTCAKLDNGPEQQTHKPQQRLKHNLSL